jgi:peptidoglycan/xylan/chitin deacetylase (PgdA/CDA1 family)
VKAHLISAARLLLSGFLLSTAGELARSQDERAFLPVPDKLVVLTFDDAVRSHATVVAPILKEYGFGATFFISEGWDFATNKRDYMTWEQIAELYRDGFEIGNHTLSHMGVTARSLAKLDGQLRGIEQRCAEHGIPRPVSFAWPGNATTPLAFEILKRHGIRFARRGGSPECAYAEGRGFAYQPHEDHPLLLPSAGDSRPIWTMDNFLSAVSQAKDGRIAILQFHGVPDTAHHWVSTPPEQFEAFMKYLALNGFRVIALRELSRYVDSDRPTEQYQTLIAKRTEVARRQIDAENDELAALWPADLPVPEASELAPLKDVEFHVVKERVPKRDGYNWLHGIALAFHRDRLLASFGHNTGSENTASEVANGSFSRDGGKSWGPLFEIDAGKEEDLAVSHGVFLNHDDKLWAFHGAFTGKMQDVHTRAYMLDDETDRWQSRGVVAKDGFWPMQEPQKMADGNWIMAGISVTDGYGGLNDPAAVAISENLNFDKWTVIRIPKPAGLEMWGESTVLVDGAEVLLISRYRQPVALTSVSRDYGRTWTPIRESRLPMTASKPYAGTLSNGQRYLVCTTIADSGNRR